MRRAFCGKILPLLWKKHSETHLHLHLTAEIDGSYLHNFWIPVTQNSYKYINKDIYKVYT